MAAADWAPKTTTEVLGADYQPPEGGPTVEQLNASPVWQSVLAQMAGAPSTIPYSGNLEGQLMPALLSGELALDLISSWGPQPPAPAHWGTAPVPGEAGWVNPTWAEGALPGGRPPPAPSTNDLGHYMPDATGSTWDPYSQGTATPNSWLGKAQGSFPQGPPSAPVVNQWQKPDNFTPPRDRYNAPLGMPWFNGSPGWQAGPTPNPQWNRGPGQTGADPKTAWGTRPWYS
jgi:hypothetical protein